MFPPTAKQEIEFARNTTRKIRKLCTQNGCFDGWFFDPMIGKIPCTECSRLIRAAEAEAARQRALGRK